MYVGSVEPVTTHDGCVPEHSLQTVGGGGVVVLVVEVVEVVDVDVAVEVDVVLVVVPGQHPAGMPTGADGGDGMVQGMGQQQIGKPSQVQSWFRMAA